MKKWLKIVFFMTIIFIVSSITFFCYVQKNDIDKILENKHYSYLPVEVKKYLKAIYEETGELILTEKNKQPNMPYLNPEYIEYLSYINNGEKIDADTRYEVIPNETIVDYSYSASSSQLNSLEIPSTFDLRNVNGKNFVTPIKDQELTGLCWAFATNAQAESYLLIKNNSSYEKGKSQLFSEVQIDYATATNGVIDGTSLYPQYNRILAEGGNFRYVVDVMSDGLGLVESFPKNIDNYDELPMEKNVIYRFNNSKYDVTGTVDYPKLNLGSLDLSVQENVDLRNSYLSNLKKLIMENGGAYVGTGDPVSRCAYTKNGYRFMYDDGKCASAGHAMQIIGWDDNYEYKFCSGLKDSSNYYYIDPNNTSCSGGKIISGKGAWILKNSWGTMQPYVYLAYDSFDSDINLIRDMDDRDWDKYYSVIRGSYNTYNYEKSYEAQESLSKIKFTANTQLQNFDVYVGTSSDDLVKLKTLYVDYPGLYTISFDEYNIEIKDKLLIKIVPDVGFGPSRIDVYTKNINDIAEIRTEDVYYEPLLTNEDKYVFRISSQTNGIPENTKIDYKILDQRKNEIIDSYYYSENSVFANQVFSKLYIENTLSKGTYILQSILNGKVLCESKLIIQKDVVSIQGSGTENDPYIINTPAQLDLIRLNRYAFYKLGKDIDLTYDTQNPNGLFYNGGKGWEPIKFSEIGINNNNFLSFWQGFSGGFDGNNHKIKGLYINRPDELAVGLFAHTYNENYSNLHIKNVTLVEPNIIGDKFVGSLIGAVHGTTYERHHTIQNIQVVGGSIKGNEYVGGIAGYINAGSYIKGLQAYRHIFDNLYNSASVEATNYAGGIVGLLMNIDSYGADKSPITMSNMLNIGSVTSNNAGGFVGFVKTRATNDITIRESINTGIVSGESDSNNIFGYFDTASDGNFNLTNVYYIGDSNLNIENEKIKVNNVSGKNISGLKDITNYSLWNSFSSNWKLEPVAGILRFPLLHNVELEYTKIDVDELEMNFSTDVNLYDLVNPKERIFFEVADESILIVDDSGNISVKNAGETTIKVSSYYDGFEKALKVNVSKNKTKITFESNGGTPVDEIVEYVSDKITEPEVPIRENYRFEGWYTDNVSFRKKYEFDIMPRKDLVLYAKWTRISSKIIFESNGGNEVSPMIGYAGEIIFSPRDPERLNYKFEGWYTDNETFENKFEFDEMPATNIVLYAKWSRISSKITFESNGGTVVESIIGYAGDELIKPDNPERLNYKFEGWYIDNETFKTLFELSVMPSEDLILYAKWTRIESKITFESNGGTTVESISGYAGDKITKPDDPRKINYKFEGWYTDNETFETKYVFDVLPETDLILYAKWSRIESKITFESNGGTAVESINGYAGDKITKPNDPERENYKFEGWYVDNETFNFRFVFKEMSETDLILYAKWSKIERKITFESNGGTVVEPIIGFVGDKITKPVDPTRQNYKFLGWYTDNTLETLYEFDVIPDMDVTLYAKWEQTFSFIINEYAVDNKLNIIHNIPLGTTKEVFENNLILNDNYTYKLNLKDTIINTGSILQIYYNDNLYYEYTNVIRGDVDGDGKLSLSDIMKIANYLYQDNNSLKEFYLVAADYNNDTEYNLQDIMKIASKLYG